MTATHRMIIGATLCMALGFAGCASTGSSNGTNFLYKNYTVAGGSAVAGEGRSVLFEGKPLARGECCTKTTDCNQCDEDSAN